MKKKPYVKRYNRELFIMQFPGMFILFIIVIIPVIMLLYYSTLYYRLQSPDKIRFVGFENYIHAFMDKAFLESIWTTVRYIVFALAIQIPLGLLLMELISNLKRYSNIFKSAFLPPMIIPPIVSGLIWRFMFLPGSGIVNYFLRFFNISPAWFTDKRLAMLSIIIVDVWMYTPFLLIIFLSGRASIAQDLYESATLDGAKKIQCFWGITLPLLRNSMIVGILFRLIDLIKVFATIHIMTTGGPGTATQTINYYTYRMAFSYSDIGYSSALGTLLLVISVVLAVVLFRAFAVKKGDLYE